MKRTQVPRIRKLTIDPKIFIFLFISILFGIHFVGRGLSAEPTTASFVGKNEKFVDLRNWDFTNEPILALQDHWIFTPGEWNLSPNEKSFPIELSVLLNWNQINPTKPGIPEGLGIGTYSILLRLPPNAPPLGVYLETIRTTSWIYQDTTLIGKIGDPGKAEEETETMNRERIILPLLPSDKEFTRITFQVKNYTINHGGLWKEIKMGTVSDLERLHMRLLSEESLIAGGLLILGIYELGHYLIRKRMISSLYFFFFCFLMFLRIITTGEKSLLYLSPGFPSIWLFRLEYFSFYAGMTVALLYLWTLTHKFLSQRVLIPVLLLFSPGIFLCFAGSPYIINGTLWIFQLLSVLYLALCIYLVIRYILAKGEGYWFFSLSFLLLVLATANDLIFFNNGGKNSTQLLQYGLLCFVVFQALFLSKRFTKEILDAEGNLKAAQYQLVQSEKLSSLGTIVAGVAHEINSPLSAIKSSSSLLTEKLQSTFQNLPILTKSFSEHEWTILEAWIQIACNSMDSLTTKEMRLIKREMITVLEGKGIAISEDLADFLVSIGCKEFLDSWIEPFQKESGKNFLESIKEIISMLQNAQTIQIASERAGKIVKSLKNFSHFDPNAEKKSASINESIETVLIILNSNFKGGVELVKELGEVPSIPCYPDELNQVWTNLIQNAVQAMDGKGILKVKTEFRSFGKENFVAVTIEDSGKGIPKEYKEKIFDPFFTTKPVGEGTGLGLHITKQIIEKHEGKIEIESQAGRTAFTILLPG